MQPGFAVSPERILRRAENIIRTRDDGQDNAEHGHSLSRRTAHLRIDQTENFVIFHYLFRR